LAGGLKVELQKKHQLQFPWKRTGDTQEERPFADGRGERKRKKALPDMNQLIFSFLKAWTSDADSKCLSRIRHFSIPDRGSGGQKGTGTRIPDPEAQHWLKIT